MSTPSPGFQGERLREAREARELSASGLANLLDVSRQLISDYENGHKSPSHETLGRISDLLRIPRHYFTTPLQPEPEAIVFYRSLASTTKTARAKAESYLAWAKRVSDAVREHVTYPPVNFPKFDLPENPSSLSRRHIEDVASEARRYWGMGDGPIGNVVWLLENNGAVVLRREFGDECLNAYSQWRIPDDRPYFVLSTDKESAVRSRFDICHELGHMLLHRRVPISTHKQTDMFKLMEAQADHFAGAFLLPATSFANECYMVTLDMFRTLKAKWRVSIGAMIARASELEMVRSDEQRRLHINLTRRGWRLREPLDDELKPEEPRLIRRAIAAVIDNRLMSQLDFELVVGLARTDIEIALGLPRGELGDTADPFRLPLVQARQPEPGLFEGDISPLPFRIDRTG